MPDNEEEYKIQTQAIEAPEEEMMYWPFPGPRMGQWVTVRSVEEQAKKNIFEQDVLSRAYPGKYRTLNWQTDHSYHWSRRGKK